MGATAATRAWRAFRSEVRPAIERDPILVALAQAWENARAGPESDRRFVTLCDGVTAALAAVRTVDGGREAAFDYYGEPQVAESYAELQPVIVPARAALVERMAAWGWASRDASERQVPARALDLATGDGSAVLALADGRPGARRVLVASDRSAAMIAAHRARLEARSVHVLEGDAGDLTRGGFAEPHTYGGISELWSRDGNFTGFDLILCSLGLHLVPDRDRLHQGVRRLLREGGVAIWAADFLDEARCRPFVIAEETLRDGYQAIRRRAAAQGRNPPTVVGYVAGFLYRRYVLQGDCPSLLADEVAALRNHFPSVHVERHTRYREFCVLVASEAPTPPPARTTLFEALT